MVLSNTNCKKKETNMRAPEDDPDEARPILVGLGLPVAVPGHRKKGTGVRAWMVVDSTGQAEVIEAGKQAIMRRTGLPARDLRILDPQLSYPSTVLGRERAIVINLEVPGWNTSRPSSPPRKCCCLTLVIHLSPLLLRSFREDLCVITMPPLLRFCIQFSLFSNCFITI